MVDPIRFIALMAEMAPLLSARARDLNDQDAFTLMMDLAELGAITLFDKVVTDKSGKITSHRPGMQTKLVPVIAGIPFLRASDKNKDANGSLGAAKPSYFAPTPAFAVVLYKFAKMLADDWDATQVVYGGIGAGGTVGVSDCHSTGHCVDFYGADTKKGTFDVRRDWWTRPVYDKDGKKHPSEGSGWAMDRWKNETNTYYRLALSIEPQDSDAADFFAAIYEFAHEETRAEAFDISPNSFSTGQPLKSGFIFHPDYPIKGSDRNHPGRDTHNDHIHFQLGNTR